MELARAVGRDAASRKYDILSALMAYGLSQDKFVQRQILRIMALITARYNWQRDELSIGQEEIARLWSVDERTVKREMAKFRSMGWLVQKRAATRGRVTVYGLDLGRMMEDTRPAWPAIGPDFVARMSPETSTPEPAGNVVPLRPATAAEPDRFEAGTIWGMAQKHLQAKDPSVYRAWFQALTTIELVGGRLILAAPSPFHASYVSAQLSHRLLAAVRDIDPAISAISVAG